MVILALAFIPLFNLKEILFYTTIYFGVHLILVCQMDVPPFIYQEMTILAGLTCYAAALQHRSLLQTFISQQKLLAMNDQLNVIANTDQLTNLLNRRGLEEHLQNNEEHHFGYYSMILIDIDLFKLYNDTYFHQAGDHCLQQVAESIKKAVINITDIISRHGGEEFLILADNLDETQLIALASKIRNAVYDLRIKMNDEPESPYLSISSGLCQKKLAPGMAVDNELVSEMFCEADQQLYLAKSHGRNCIYFNNKIYY
ncbi:hypothetical protein SDC9_121452 [bioreactor metagenome]|uniref:GGDEF domain-containing protein n=1 Tax=bioreactor metagenome TaxID=1076179 RepID=A0A645CC10_9ZZZZ